MIGMIWKRRRRKAVDEQKVENKAPTTLTTNKGKIKKELIKCMIILYMRFSILQGDPLIDFMNTQNLIKKNMGELSYDSAFCLVLRNITILRRRKASYLYGSIWPSVRM